MGKQISRATRKELVGALRERYEAGSQTEKGRVLDEFVSVTGYHRKYAIRLMNGAGSQGKRSRARPRIYDEAVRQALVVLWEASDRVCGKRLRPLLPILVNSLEKHGHLNLDESVRERVLAVSAASIDRLLADTRAVATGVRRRSKKVSPGLRAGIAVRTFADWNEPAPGHMEIDLVAHCGESPSGSFLNTLSLTDISSGWTECIPLLVRDSALVVESLAGLRTTMPFPLRGIDADNGSEFMNERVVDFCLEHHIEFTRSRPYHKNDQAWIEQKNGSVVRRLVGYRRLEGVKAAKALARLYAASRFFVNFFQPSFRLLSKVRQGARVVKRYDVPTTPYARLMASDVIPQSAKEGLRSLADNLDPLGLLDEVRSAQHCLAALAAGQEVHVPVRDSTNLDDFLRGLATAWKDGEVRPTHANRPKPERHWRTRDDPFEAVWPQVDAWLKANPDSTAKELLDRLHEAHPGDFSDGQLRSLQRRVKEWRSSMAKRLVFQGQGLGSSPPRQ